MLIKLRLESNLMPMFMYFEINLKFNYIDNQLFMFILYF